MQYVVVEDMTYPENRDEHRFDIYGPFYDEDLGEKWMNSRPEDPDLFDAWVHPVNTPTPIGE